MSDSIKPAIILVRPQLGENIGKTARAMLNFGLTDLRLVSPRDGWPNPDAGPSAAGADSVLENACVFDSVEEAIEDCTLVFATTVRERDMSKPVASPREAAAQMHSAINRGERPAILYGPERSGLDNDDISVTNCILTVPVNPEFSSLNLAQAVVLTAYEFSQSSDVTPAFQPAFDGDLASKDEIIGMVEHIETELDKRGYFRSKGRRDSQVRTLFNLTNSAGLSPQQVQTWRGIIKSLARSPRDD